MFNLSTDIIFLIIEYLGMDCKNFLKFLKSTNNNKYNEIILSLNKKINQKYQILNIIDEIYINIDSINTINKYMRIKGELFNINIKSRTIETNIFIKQLINLYYNSLKGKNKKKFNNLCVILDCPRINDFIKILRIDPKLSIKNVNIYLDNYLIIKQELNSLITL